MFFFFQFQRKKKCRSSARTVSDALKVMEAMAGFDQNDYEATLRAAKYIPLGG